MYSARQWAAATLVALALWGMPSQAPRAAGEQTSSEQAQVRKGESKAEGEAESPERRARTAGAGAAPRGSAQEAPTAPIESVILGYEATGQAVSRIAQAVKAAEAQKVVLLSATDVDASASLRALELQAASISQRVQALAMGPALQVEHLPVNCARALVLVKALPVVSADWVAPLAALARVDSSLAGSSVPTDHFSLLALLSRELKRVGIDVAYPSLYLLADGGASKDSRAQELFHAIVRAQTSLDVAYLKFQKLQVQLLQRAASSKQAACRRLLEADMNALSEHLARIKSLQRALEQFVAAASAAGARAEMSYLQSLIAWERLSKSFGPAHSLYVKQVASGGTTHTRTGIGGSTVWRPFPGPAPGRGCRRGP